MPARDGEMYTLRVKGGRGTLHVETAVTSAARTQGLSGRPRLPPGHGMFFVFDTIQEQSMWMSGMRFALDVVWLDEYMRIVSVARDCRPCVPGRPCVTFASGLPIKYAIEVAAGEADRLGFVEGARVVVD